MPRPTTVTPISDLPQQPQQRIRHTTTGTRHPSWEAVGAGQDVLELLRGRIRLAEGRIAEPSAAVIDSASVWAAETVGEASRGNDTGKKVNGRKRYIAVDTLGLLLCVLVTLASVQDRDGAKPLREALCTAHRRIRLVWADGGYAGKLKTGHANDSRSR